MPSARAVAKRKPRRFRVSAIRIQVHFILKVPRGYAVSRKFLNEVWELWLDSGQTPKNIIINVIEWTGTSRGTARGVHATETARRNFRAVFKAATVTIRADSSAN